MIRRRLVKAARRVPGYRQLRRAVLPRVQQSPTARALIRRVFALEVTKTAPVDVTPGRVIVGNGTEALPVVVVIMVGLPDKTVYEVVDEVAKLQLLGAGFRPVLVSDGPVLQAARQFGYPVEVLVPEHKWSDYGEGSWNEYVGRRISLTLSTYRAGYAMRGTSEGLDDIVRAMLESLGWAEDSTANDRRLSRG